MYRMLIVDDEPIIVEGLMELFGTLDECPLEVYAAYDGCEALQLVRGLRMDIILTDIEMPEMNGIELQQEVSRLWPRTKFIFLTGYNDFSYIQSTIRGGAMDYVLKTEGDEPIIAAVQKAIDYIQQEMTHDQLIHRAREQLVTAIPSMRKEFLAGLLQGELPDRAKLERRLQELAVPFDPDKPLWLAVGRIDAWRPDTTEADRALYSYSVHNIMGEFVSDHFELVHWVGEKHRLIWLLQQKQGPAPDVLDQPFTFLLGMMESVQHACNFYLKLPCSFVVSSEAYAWAQLPMKFEKLTLLFERGLGLGKEMLLSDERMFAEGREEASYRIRRIRLLDQYLTQKQKPEFHEQLEEVLAGTGDHQLLQTGVTLEIFYELTAIFISHLNRADLLPLVSEKIHIGKLLSIREHDSWEEVGTFFRELAELLFECLSEGKDQETSEVVQTINHYIEEHLAGDLSLNTLASQVYLTPFYVSRLYKMHTGKSLTEAISETRISKAKDLLVDPQYKVHEVGAQIGYDSPSYFTRFFKKLTGLTPQEYRDAYKRI